jgi:hypothetical protein
MVQIHIIRFNSLKWFKFTLFVSIHKIEIKNEENGLNSQNSF